ncbi:MAG: MmcQ/YjbR family DNA-binding protein [Flavobacteriales bacterium]|nr:MmcQ/YjbR family DNA-binding protein [Flavobacteriales bacterium]
MDTQTVRAMALDMPGTAEKGQFGRPSFSVKKKTYLNLWTEEQRAVLKLTPAQQAAFCEASPDAFSPSHKLGQHGWTSVELAHTNERLFRYAVDLAWRNVAPKWLVPTRQAPVKG